MPLASMLEMDKPFVFASSHTNGSSTELHSNSSPNKTTLSRPVHHSSLTHTKLPSSLVKDRSHYYSPTIPSDYDTPDTHQIMVGGLSSHYQQGQKQQTKIVNGYLYSTTTSTQSNKSDLTSSYPCSSSSSSSSSSSTLTTLNSQLPSPSTPLTNISPTNITPPISKSLSFTSNLQQLPTPQLQDSAYSLASHHLHGLPSSRHDLPPIDHHVKIADAGLSLLNNFKASTSLPPIPKATATTTLLPPELITTSTKILKRTPDDEVDSGFCDNNAVDNRRLKRRKEMNQRLDALNNDFIQSKERIFAEKLLVIQNEIGQIHSNTHPKYKEGLILLELTRQKTINDGQLVKEYQTKVSDHQFTLEIQLAEEEYKAERQQIREKLFAVLEEKRRKLKEDKDNCDLTYDVVSGEAQTRVNKRNCLRRRGLENGDNKSNKRKQVSDILFIFEYIHLYLCFDHSFVILNLLFIRPSLVFKLKDDEVYDDLQAMRCVSWMYYTIPQILTFYLSSGIIFDTSEEIIDTQEEMKNYLSGYLRLIIYIPPSPPFLFLICSNLHLDLPPLN
ncbi:Sds3-like-domain-containing protein [Chlamydoabsidia padenii]|nr:Sds3-like-domain-containing protein [Chlamydoabsidia padenii]